MERTRVPKTWISISSAVGLGTTFLEADGAAVHPVTPPPLLRAASGVEAGAEGARTFTSQRDVQHCAGEREKFGRKGAFAARCQPSRGGALRGPPRRITLAGRAPPRGA